MTKLKQAIKGKTSKVTLDKRAFISRTSNVTVVYWHYTKENPHISSNVQSQSEIDNLTKAMVKTIQGTINTDIAACSISKNIDHPSASFNLTLLPSKNWRQVIAPGDWVAIYFHQGLETEGDAIPDVKNLVLVGNIDRVARSVQKDEETDTTQMRYEISGRNFGKVFEQTDLWYDPYMTQDSVLDVALRTAGLNIIGNPSVQVEAGLNVFIGDGEQFADGRTPALKQWFVPPALAQIFKEPTGFTNAAFANDTGQEVYFNSILDRHIQKDLPGFNDTAMIGLESNGSVWEFLKRASNELINELYLEESRDESGNVRPTIFLKPRPVNTPFIEDQFDSPASFAMIKNAYQTLQNLAETSFIEISQSEIIYENLGRDDHSRINMVWMKTDLEHQYQLSPVANVEGGKQLGNPTFSRPSIKRHGLRRMDSLLEFCHTTSDGISETRGINTDINLFRGFMGQLYDMNFANHLYEQGTIECYGVLEAELGKALVVKQSLPNAPDKVYFIEGYEHKWTYPSTWTTVFTVTKGQFKDANRPFIDVMGFGDNGQADTSLDATYVAGTKGRK